jgi:hypothetical protein
MYSRVFNLQEISVNACLLVHAATCIRQHVPADTMYTFRYILWGILIKKYNISYNVYKHFDSPAGRENIYSSRIAINQPVTEEIQEERKTFILMITGCELRLSGIRNDVSLSSILVLLLISFTICVIVYISCLIVVILINYSEFLLHDGLKFCLLTSQPRTEVV